MESICSIQHVHESEIVLIMRTDRLCLRYLFIVLRLLLDKRLVDQHRRSLDLFDREAFGIRIILFIEYTCFHIAF